VSLIVAGTIRVPPDQLDGLRPHMVRMTTATRGEDGCATYSYAEDVAEPGLIHVFEIWRDDAALAAHFETDHMARWREVWPRFGVSDRRLFAYEVASERVL
jgi:quinol monooxygenase YgiN